MKRKLFIKTYGCQMNVYDSNRMVDILSPLGFESTDEMDGADLVIFNTCHIREKASEKLYSDLGRAKPFKEKSAEEGKDMLIAVAGCSAQAEGSEVFRRAPYVDMVFGPQSYQELPEMLARAARAKDEKKAREQYLEENPEGDGQSLQAFKKKGLGILNVDFPEEPKFDTLPEIYAHEGPSAFVAIQEGCDKFCHFCVVPYTRGAEYSRPAKDVLGDVLKLVNLGVKEITLLGQNVNAYHGQNLSEEGEWTLGQLIKAVAEIEGVSVIRYTTSHPRDVNDDLIQAHRDVTKLAPMLHLPVQSGSDRILKTMNRKHTRQEFLESIAKFRKANPLMAFSSDFIVGYPGETEQDFQDTLDLVRTVNFVSSYSFKYSPRPGTPAATMAGQVPEDIADRRLQELQQLLTAQQIAFNQSLIGQEMKVLLERPGKTQGQYLGKSPFMQSVVVNANPRLVGSYVSVKITSATMSSLSGEIILQQ